MLDLQQIQQSQTPPALFERGKPMWHDPYIATQMLKFHLDESHDIASRRPELIDKTVSWIMNRLDLQAGMRLLDLGCGPGLYTQRFAKQGLQVTGVDYSQYSIDYATAQDTQSMYICQNYVELDLPDQSFDVVVMIYGDFCVLTNGERDNLLAKVHQLLKSDGHFVFDVTQPQAHLYLQGFNRWSVTAAGGFWKPVPYLVLEQGFVYPDDITLHQYTVIESDGAQTLYRNWYHDYTPATLSFILESFGYNKVDSYGDLIGTPYSKVSDWLGIIAQI